MSTVVITGGLGFIGSHICVELLQSNYNVIILDNLENSSIDVYDKLLQLTNTTKKQCMLEIVDITDRSKTFAIFKKYAKIYNISGIIHCAGKKSVNESIRKPLIYYRDNLNMTYNILECVELFNIKTFIFSSSATVYGNANGSVPLTENSTTGIGITNPYGQTKYMQEQIINDFAVNHNDKAFINLRYFNPVGAHKSGMIGENPKDIPNNLMPYILRVAANNNGYGFDDDVYKQLTIFGDDYNTLDGTCIRDFIHVVDLAKAHVAVLDFPRKQEQTVWTFNVGTGNGVSVLELVNAVKTYNDVDITYVFGKRREGDVEKVVCDCTYIKEVVGWEAQETIESIATSSWDFIS